MVPLFGSATLGIRFCAHHALRLELNAKRTEKSLTACEPNSTASATRISIRYRLSADGPFSNV